MNLHIEPMAVEERIEGREYDVLTLVTFERRIPVGTRRTRFFIVDGAQPAYCARLASPVAMLTLGRGLVGAAAQLN